MTAKLTRADREEISERRLRFRNPRQERSDYKDEWWGEQCLHYAYYLPLYAELGEDFGECCNGCTPHDGRFRFEYDGCELFEFMPDDS